ncbi:MAG: glycosyltransferase family 4 protein [Candidatus Nealsonbacteria bacterium]|nr:glycosyltransferase family 4 protein [Candidatus Nealsonbacteria bacterium]
MKKILIITNNLEGRDGWSRVSLDFSEELKRQGNEILYLTSKEIGEPSKYFSNPLSPFFAAKIIEKAVSGFSPDVIHFMVEPYALCLPFLKTGGAKVFLTVHGTYSVIPALFGFSFRKAILSYLSKKYLNRLDGIVAVSNYTKNHLLKYYPDLRDKVRVITNGIDLKKHKPIDYDQKQKNQIKKVLFVGEVKKRKGILEAMEALNYYRKEFSDNFIYDIVGKAREEDEYRKDILRKAKEYGLENKVFFRGEASDESLEDYYLRSDLLLMTSLNTGNYFEGFGLVFLEAAAKGTPGIGSRDSGCQEAILDGKTGYLAEWRDPKDIAEKMDLILNKNAIQPKICVEWAKQNDISIKAKELINLYE